MLESEKMLDSPSRQKLDSPSRQKLDSLSRSKLIGGDPDNQEPTYPWHTFKPSVLLGCFNIALQLVLLGGGGSFLFGFCMAGLNTATKTINSVFLMCGDGDLWARFDGISPAKCEAIPQCKEKCGVMKDGKVELVRCPGGYNDVGTYNPVCESSLKWKNAFLVSSVLIGATIGSLMGSRFLAYGRRRVLLGTMIVFLLGTVACTMSNSYSSLLGGRLIVGYAVGLVSVASPTYMSEVTPKERRGSYGVVHQLGIVIGIFLPLLLGLALKDPSEQDDLWVPEPFQRFWWRFMVAVAILPILLVLYLLAFVYSFETPVYYVEQRRFKDAASLLELIRGTEDIKEELDNVIENVRQGETAKDRRIPLRTAVQNPEYRHVIIVGILFSAFQQFGGINVFITSSNTIFKKAGLSGTMQTTMSIVMGLINVVMTFPTLYLIERMGRRSLMLLGSAGQTLAIVPAAVMYWISPEEVGTQVLAIIGVLGFVTFFALAYGPVMGVYLFEIYPLEIKDVAAGVAIAANWGAGVVMVFTAQLINNQIAFTLFASLQLTGTLLIFFLMKETNGIPLGQSPFITKRQRV